VKRPPFAFERFHEPLVPIRVFYGRLVWSGLVALGLILVLLSIGVAGYHWIAGLEWVDALLNASMILGGMGPVDTLHNDASKIFASAYALFSGVTFLSSVGVFLSPALHRLVHHFHLEADSSGSDSSRKS
jgi:hypothetical protein